jgi:hypothetical protein
MKRLFTIFLAFLYLALSSGLAMQIHHCMDKIAAVSLIPSGEINCGSCGMPKGENNCCKDELRFVKIPDSFKVLQADYRLPSPAIATAFVRYLEARLMDYEPLPLLATACPPPGLPPAPLFLLHGVFRI